MTSPNTDSRILTILRSGEAARRAVDPDCVLASSFVSELSFRMEGEAPTWMAVMNCPSGDQLLVAGSFFGEGVIVENALLQCEGRHISLPVKAASRLFEAFGTLSDLPDALKRNLSFMGEHKALDGDNPFGMEIYGLVRSALFHSVDGAEEKKLCGRFDSIKISYQYSSDRVCYGAKLSCVCFGGSYDVVLSVNLDVYGMKGKRVFLNYVFEGGRTIDADCYVVNDGKKKPSIALAFDLAEKLSDRHVRERHKKKDMGRPVAR